MADPNDIPQENFGAVQIVEPGGGGLNGDALGATLGAELEDEASEEKDDGAGEADVTASGAE